MKGPRAIEGLFFVMASKVTEQQSDDRTGQSGLLATATVAARLAGVAALSYAGLFFFSIRKARH